MLGGYTLGLHPGWRSLPRVLRLATWNLLHGRSLRNGSGEGTVDADQLAAAIAALNVDVLGVQEVDQYAARSGDVDQAAVVAEAMGARWHHFAPAVVGTPGTAGWRRAVADDDGAGGPRYGVALATRLPVRRFQVRRLAGSPLPGVILDPCRGRPVPRRDEPRVLLLADLEAPWGLLRVCCAHLSFVPGWNVGQLVTLLGAAAPEEPGGTAAVLADLNLPGRLVRLLARGWRLLADVPSYPASNPAVQLDHILGRGPLPAVTTVDSPRMAIGDHRPVVVGIGEKR